MYDRKQEANEFVGESVEDATASAARFYGMEAAELRVAVAPEGSVYGAGGRTVVVAFPRSAKRPQSTDSAHENSSRGPGRGRGREESRGRERDGRGRRRERENKRSEETDSGSADEPVANSKGIASGELGQVGDFVLGVIERMAVGSFEISEASENDFLVYQVRGPACERLGSGDGRAVDALQLLANQASKQLLDDGPRIVIDIEGETADREDSLSRLADRAASRALDTGRTVALDPMNARDRRIIHVALRDEDKVATMSIGSGRYRQVVVVPEGADEYDEAVNSSQAAGS